MTPLRRRMTEDMQVRSLSPQTQATYVQQVSLFARHFNKSPELLGPEDIRSYQVYLTNEKKLAPSSILIAIAALRFLYKVTLHKGLEPGRNYPGAQEASEVANCLESRRGPAVLKLRTELQASHDPDDLLRCRAAHLRGYPPESRRYRQPANGHSSGTGQRAEMLLITFLAFTVEIQIRSCAELPACSGSHRPRTDTVYDGWGP